MNFLLVEDCTLLPQNFHNLDRLKQSGCDLAFLLVGCHRARQARHDGAEVELEFAGTDDKWIYHVHRFWQRGELRAIGITRALIWKRDVPAALSEMMAFVGATELRPPPPWVASLFESDRDVLEIGGASA